MMLDQLSARGKAGLLFTLVLWHVACTLLIYLAAFREMPWTIAVYFCAWFGVSAVWRYRAPQSTEEVVFGKRWGMVHGLFFIALVFVEMGLLLWLFLKSPWLSLVAGMAWIAGYWQNPIFTLRHSRRAEPKCSAPR